MGVVPFGGTARLGARIKYDLPSIALLGVVVAVNCEYRNSGR
jgi:hypothetical protein